MTNLSHVVISDHDLILSLRERRATLCVLAGMLNQRGNLDASVHLMSAAEHLAEAMWAIMQREADEAAASVAAEPGESGA